MYIDSGSGVDNQLSMLLPAVDLSKHGRPQDRRPTPSETHLWEAGYFCECYRLVMRQSYLGCTRHSEAVSDCIVNQKHGPPDLTVTPSDMCQVTN